MITIEDNYNAEDNKDQNIRSKKIKKNNLFNNSNNKIINKEKVNNFQNLIKIQKKSLVKLVIVLIRLKNVTKTEINIHKPNLKKYFYYFSKK